MIDEQPSRSARDDARVPYAGLSLEVVRMLQKTRQAWMSSADEFPPIDAVPGARTRLAAANPRGDGPTGIRAASCRPARTGRR